LTSSALNALIHPHDEFPKLAREPSFFVFFLLASVNGIQTGFGKLVRESVADASPPSLFETFGRHVFFGCVEGVVRLSVLALLLVWVTRKAPRPLEFTGARSVLGYASLPLVVPLLAFTVLLVTHGDPLLREGSDPLKGSLGSIWWLVLGLDMVTGLWSLALSAAGIAALGGMDVWRGLGQYFLAFITFAMLTVVASAALVWRDDRLVRSMADIAGKHPPAEASAQR
jgi:Yip1-like protein